MKKFRSQLKDIYDDTKLFKILRDCKQSFWEKPEGQKLWNLLSKNSNLAKTTFTRREVDTTRSWKPKPFPWPVGPYAMSEIFPFLLCLPRRSTLVRLRPLLYFRHARQVLPLTSTLLAPPPETLFPQISFKSLSSTHRLLCTTWHKITIASIPALPSLIFSHTTILFIHIVHFAHSGTELFTKFLVSTPLECKPRGNRGFVIAHSSISST